MNAATKTSPLPKRQPNPPPDPGVYEGVENRVYQKYNAMQTSGLKRLADSPLSFQHWLSGAPELYKAELMFGIAGHAMLLEPKRFDREVVYVPGLKDGAVSSTWEKQVAANPGRIVCAESWSDFLPKMRAKVMENAEARDLLTDPSGISEVMVVWYDEYTRLLCKVLLDRVNFTDTHVIVTGLKTARTLDDFLLGKAMWDMGYHLELAHSIAGARAAAQFDGRFTGREVIFQWLDVTNDDPVDASIDEPDDEFHQVGFTHYRQLMALAARCYESGKYPGVCRTMSGEPTTRRTISLPHYALKEFGIGAGGGM